MGIVAERIAPAIHINVSHSIRRCTEWFSWLFSKVLCIFLHGASMSIFTSHTENAVLHSHLYAGYRGNHSCGDCWQERNTAKITKYGTFSSWTRIAVVKERQLCGSQGTHYWCITHDYCIHVYATFLVHCTHDKMHLVYCVVWGITFFVPILSLYFCKHRNIYGWTISVLRCVYFSHSK